MGIWVVPATLFIWCTSIVLTWDFQAHIGLQICLANLLLLNGLAFILLCVLFSFHLFLLRRKITTYEYIKGPKPQPAVELHRQQEVGTIEDACAQSQSSRSLRGTWYSQAS